MTARTLPPMCPSPIALTARFVGPALIIKDVKIMDYTEEIPISSFKRINIQFPGDVYFLALLEWANGKVPGSYFGSEIFNDFRRMADNWAASDPGQLSKGFTGMFAIRFIFRGTSSYLGRRSISNRWICCFIFSVGWFFFKSRLFI
jgi:hypothetical protein